MLTTNLLFILLLLNPQAYCSRPELKTFVSLWVLLYRFPPSTSVLYKVPMHLSLRHPEKKNRDHYAHFTDGNWGPEGLRSKLQNLGPQTKFFSVVFFFFFKYTLSESSQLPSYLWPVHKFHATLWALCGYLQACHSLDVQLSPSSVAEGPQGGLEHGQELLAGLTQPQLWKVQDD